MALSSQPTTLVRLPQSQDGFALLPHHESVLTHFVASYGSLARFSGVHRLLQFPTDRPTSVVGCGGDVSDMQAIERLLLSLSIEENYSSTSSTSLHASNVHTYLSKVLYKRRSDFNPLWNHILVGGFDDKGAPFLGSADLLGTTFLAPTLATGFGTQIAVPILRKVCPDEEASKQLTKEQAVAAIKECLKVLYYRDARSSREYSIAVISKGGVELKNGEQLEQQSWAFAENIRGYGRTTE